MIQTLEVVDEYSIREFDLVTICYTGTLIITPLNGLMTTYEQAKIHRDRVLRELDLYCARRLRVKEDA